MDVKTIGVIGAGAMGRGIACLSAISGFRTVLEDVSPAMLEQGVAYVRETLEESVALRRLPPEEKARSLANLSTACSVEDACRQADLLIEALPEEMELKLEIFTIFDKFAKPDAILATNTSSFSITELAAITFRAENCVGMHFYDPVPEAKLLEIIRALETSEATVAACAEVGRRLGKDVVVLRDSPGFITGRINAMIGNEAFYMLQEGIASAADIDRALKLGLNHPRGPFELVDLVGLDVRLTLLEYLYKRLGEKYRPCPLLEEYVRAGRLGRKVGRGVYEYSADGKAKSAAG
jgi:3-hydroxybutyryl-CoA dehydrogenase